MTKKPTPPPQSQLDAEIREALAALGVSDYQSPRRNEDAVHAALLDLWKENKTPPTGYELADKTGLQAGTVRSILFRLLKQKRVLNPEHGVWVPK